MTRPGWRFRAIAARILDDKTMERVVDPMVADLQSEFADAVRRGRMWRSRWILLGGYAVFLKTIVWCGMEEAMQSMAGWTADDRSAMSRTIAFSIVTIAAATALFVGLPLMLASRLGGRVDPTLLVYSLPQALVLAVPIGFTFGVLLGLRDRVVSSRTAGAILGCAFLCSVACLVTLAWILPTANAEFRRQRLHQEGTIERKNLNELTLGELGQQIDSDRRAGSRSANLPFLYHAYHVRWALSGATIVLVVFALSLTRRLVARWTVSFAAFAACFGYYALLSAGREAALQGTLPAFAGAWMPNVVFAIVSVTLLKLRPPSEQRALR